MALPFFKTKPVSSGQKHWGIKKKILAILGIFLLGFLAMETTLILSGMVGNSRIRTHNPSTTSFIRVYEMRSGKRVQLQWLPIKSISNNLIRAVLVAEDDAFFDHEGLDLKEMKKSWEINIKKKRIVRGGSTLTMQLVKNLYLSGSKSPLRKLNEIILALDLDYKVSKGRILEVYLNVVEWGGGIYGAEAASQHYFNQSAKSLSSSQAAYLAALLPNPIYLSGKGKRRATRRQSIILRRMGRRPLPKDL